ncbi:hypothetical protein [Variovorax sp. OV329]|uniref:hypothetical protein n=1 Tax=Variovorax sp. OV329 TaxID=1882825 RepID=UPI0008E41019|nr:hypothetical protein [Variovorax sp. OV329]SFM99073.1 hypothetical protein SAMN05444747_112149 [Variovorax sp. OV329]
MSASIPLQSPRRLSRREAWLAGAALLLLALGLLAPALAEPGAGNSPLSDFRTLLGLPNALDVLSNLPFLIVGLLGLHRLHRLERGHDHGPVPGHAHDELPGSALDSAWLFFAGLVLVSGASAFYHLQPDDVLRLAGDRAAMAVAFAGVMGLAVSDRVSPRFGFPAACITLAAGLLAVAVFHERGNIMPWAVVQFGGIALVLWMSTLRPVRSGTRPLDLKLGWIIAAYAVAKVLEVGDGPVFEWTQHIVSGHSLKHVVAALAALPVLYSIRQLADRPLMHNSPAAPVTV